MSKIKTNKEQKRILILKSAQELFLTEGYIQTSMDSIASKAQVTKQTVYRYFTSKEELFEATLDVCREQPHEDFFEHLDNPDTREALLNFAVDFIQVHLTKEHLAIMRLLIAESDKAPELTRTFFAFGPGETDQKLDAFFKERFQVKESGNIVRIWTGMLLSLRTSVLMGLSPPTEKEIREYAEQATDFFLKSME